MNLLSSAFIQVRGISTSLVFTILFTPTFIMEEATIINLMRNMKVNCAIPLEELYHLYPEDAKLYLGRPEMLVMTMRNGRNMQAFRGGKVQILGRVSDAEAENMRLNFMMKLRRIEKMRHSQVTKMTISNLVISVRLKKALSLHKINLTDANFFHEYEIFPATLIRLWHPVHIAAFQNGRVILTGIKSVEHFYEIMFSLTSFLETSNLLREK